MKAIVVVAWHNPDQKERFCHEWGVTDGDERVHFQQDKDKSGCAKTKNAGIEAALGKKSDVIIVLDDDCFPQSAEIPGGTVVNRNVDQLQPFIDAHVEALRPQEVQLYEAVTDPPSRGTPYQSKTVTMHVAAVMGFWTEVGDYDAPSQLVWGATHPMEFRRETMFWRFFPFSGMNCSFPAEWWPRFRFNEEHDRFDDIFMGYKFQRAAYSVWHCINLCGPLVRHSRQSNVWHNLRVESKAMELNETIWKTYVG